MDHSHINSISIDEDGNRSEVPPLIVDGDHTLSATRSGGVCVHSGTFTLPADAALNGSLAVQPSAHAAIVGTHNGSLRVGSAAVVDIHGVHNGSTPVEAGGLARIRSGAHVNGSLTIAGRLENEGTRGGTVKDQSGQLVDLPGAVVRLPERLPNGMTMYRG